jgi:HEAT repeat protein
MSSRRDRAGIAVALALGVGCGRTPPTPPRETAPDSPPVVTTPPLDAGRSVDASPPPDASRSVDASPPPPDTPMQRTLSAKDQKALDDALMMLDDEHQQGYEPAMRWLADHPDLSRPPLIELVETYKGAGDMDGERAALVLGRISHPDDLPLLERGLYSAEPEVGKWTFLEALLEHQDPSVTQVFLTAAGSDDPGLVGVAAAGLGLRKAEEGRPILEALLDHDDYRVRYKAVLALINLGAAKSRAALKARKKVEKNGDVRGAIRKALK